MSALHVDVDAARDLAVDLEGAGLAGDEGEVEHLLWDQGVGFTLFVILYLKAMRLHVRVADRDVHRLTLRNGHLGPRNARRDAGPVQLAFVISKVAGHDQEAAGGFGAPGREDGGRGRTG